MHCSQRVFAGTLEYVGSMHNLLRVCNRFVSISQSFVVSSHAHMSVFLYRLSCGQVGLVFQDTGINQ